MVDIRTTRVALLVDREVDRDVRTSRIALLADRTTNPNIVIEELYGIADVELYVDNVVEELYLVADIQLGETWGDILNQVDEFIYEESQQLQDTWTIIDLYDYIHEWKELFTQVDIFNYYQIWEEFFEQIELYDYYHAWYDNFNQINIFNVAPEWLDDFEQISTINIAPEWADNFEQDDIFHKIYIWTDELTQDDNFYYMHEWQDNFEQISIINIAPEWDDDFVQISTINIAPEWDDDFVITDIYEFVLQEFQSDLTPETLCRTFLYDALRRFSPVPIRDAGNPLLHPSRLYAEIRFPESRLYPTIEVRFMVTILVIATPRSTDNIYQYIDVANQFHDFLEKLALMVPKAGCLIQDGILKVDDFGFVDKAETIRQATVTCEVTLEM